MSQAKTDLHPRPEKTIGSHWLRGGQTLSHTWAMVIEVLKNFSIPAILLGFLMINVVNHSADDLDQIYGSQAALISLMKQLPDEFRSDRVTIKDQAGNEFAVDYHTFDTNPDIQAHVKRYSDKLWMGTFIWALIMAGIISLSSIIFVKHGEKKVEDHIIRGQQLVSLRDLVRLILNYNIRQINEINFRTLEELGYKKPDYAKDHEIKMSVLEGIHFSILYASMAIRDGLHELIARIKAKTIWHRQFMIEERANPANMKRLTDAQKRALNWDRLDPEEQERLDTPKLDMKRVRDKAHTRTEAKLASEIAQMNPLDRRFRASKFGFVSDDSEIGRYMDGNHEAIYRLLLSEEWRDGKLTTASQMMLRTCVEMASEKNLQFYTAPARYPLPKLIQIPYPHEAERQHTLVVGGTGSGKTVAINTLIDSIKELGHKAIIYDPEGDFIKVHYDPTRDKILNPFDQRTVHWSPFLDMKDKTDWQSAAADLFADNSTEPYWTMVPRDIYSTVGHHLQLLYQKRYERNPTVAEFIQWLNGPHKMIYSLVEGTSAGRQLGETTGARVESLRSVISNVTSTLEHLVHGEANFSMKDWINDPSQKGLLFIVAPDDVAASMKPLISHWCSLATTALLSRQEDAMNMPTWVILDEFGTLKVDNLADATTRLRKFNGRVVLGIQSISQLQDAYGDKKAQTVMGQMSNLLILKLNDTETAKYFSELIGDREARRKDESVTFGAAQMRDAVSIAPKDSLERIALPEELKNLPVCHGYIKFSPGRDGPFPFAKVKYKPIDRKEISVRCVKVERVVTLDNVLPSAAKNSDLEKMMADIMAAARSVSVAPVSRGEKLLSEFTRYTTRPEEITQNEDGSSRVVIYGYHVNPETGEMVEAHHVIERDANKKITLNKLYTQNDDGTYEEIDCIEANVSVSLGNKSDQEREEEREKLAGASDAPDGIDGSRLIREVPTDGVLGLDANMKAEQERIEKLRQKEIAAIQETVTPQETSIFTPSTNPFLSKPEGPQIKPLIELQPKDEPFSNPDDELSI